MSNSQIAKPWHRVISHLQVFLLVALTLPIFGVVYTEFGKILGLTTIPVPVVGTGSMYPSLFWTKSEGGPEDESKIVVEEYRSTPHLYRRFNGISFLGKNIFRREIGLYDIVAFKNLRTAAILEAEGVATSSAIDSRAGFIKRVIGLPGDRIELRDGFVYRNKELLKEPYLATPRSTYGGSTLKDCQVFTVPPNEYFVLGDNRKISSDSRFELSTIDREDIEYVLPYKEQTLYQQLWRDPAKDDLLLGQPTLSAQDFLLALNSLRSNKGLAPLRTEPKLINSATLRGESTLSGQDPVLSLKQTTARANYKNIALAEFVSYGHFSSEELLQNLLYHPGTAKQILGKDYTDLGVAVVNQNVAGCPTQVIVGHLGGYIAATYDPSVLLSWEKLSANLDEVIPSWQSAVGNTRLDQSKLSELLTILSRRSSLAKEIVTVIKQREWFSDEQTQRLKQDELDESRSHELAKQLNGDQ